LHSTEYAHLQGVLIKQAKSATGCPSVEALKAHSKLCDWMYSKS
jgi:hypothetical protein